MGNGLADSQAHCERADAACNVGSDLSAMEWDQLNLAYARSYLLEDGSDVRKAIAAEKMRRLPAMSQADLGKLLASAERNDNSADRTMIIIERRKREPKAKPIKVRGYKASDVRSHAARSAFANPAQEFDGEARDGFGGSQRSLIDGASYAADLVLRAARGDWRQRPDVVEDRARADRPAGYPYSMSTDFCIALEAWGAECRATLSRGARFPTMKGRAHV